MNKLITLLLLCSVIISCKDNQPQTDLEQTPLVALETPLEQPVNYDILKDEVRCTDKIYTFEFPEFESTAAAEQLLHQDLISFLTRQKTTDSKTSLSDAFDQMLERSSSLCKSSDSGFSQIEVVNAYSDSVLVTYELAYRFNGDNGRKAAIYKMPNLKKWNFSALIPEGKVYEVGIIFNANLQAAVAGLSEQITDGGQRKAFMDQVGNTAYKFTVDEFETLDWTILKKDDGKKYLRVLKQVELPKQFDQLNNTVVIEIELDQLKYYLDLTHLTD